MIAKNPGQTFIVHEFKAMSNAKVGTVIFKGNLYICVLLTEVVVPGTRWGLQAVQHTVTKHSMHVLLCG